MVKLVCPVNPAHGSVVPVVHGWYCPHVDHDGRLRSHPLGEAPRTRNHFTTAEIEAGSVSQPKLTTDEVAVQS